jgi:hypothetical protein
LTEEKPSGNIQSPDAHKERRNLMSEVAVAATLIDSSNSDFVFTMDI